MVDFRDGVTTINDMGFLDVIVPFILVFVLVFAILQKTKLLGEKDGKPIKNYNMVIALVIGLAVVIPHVIGAYPPDGDVVNIINGALPQVSLILVAVLMLLLIIGVFGGDAKIMGTGLASWAVFFAIVATLVIFANAANWITFPQWFDLYITEQTKALIIVILVFALIIWYITKEDKPKETKKPGIWEEMGKVMGGSK
jgi:hypothetical protein